MVSRPRVPRVQRSTLVLIVAVAALAFPLGALAVHQFDDVPTGASFHDDVEALVAHGITSGCQTDPPLYCPSNPVTRGQMAQFLNRLGSLDGNTPPSVDADMVDGHHADGLTRTAYMATSDTTPIPEFELEVQYGGDLTIVAPGAGFVTVTGQATVQNLGCTGNCIVWGQVEHFESSFRSIFALDSPVPTSGVSFSHMSWSAVFAVDAGTNTFGIILSREDDASGVLNGWWGEATALFSPFDAAGGGAVSGLSAEPAGSSPLTKGD